MLTSDQIKSLAEEKVLDERSFLLEQRRRDAFNFVLNRLKHTIQSMPDAVVLVGLPVDVNILWDFTSHNQT